jgi:hypothetical protein
VQREAGSNPARQIERAYWIAMSRPPSDQEKAVGIEALSKLADGWAKHLMASGKANREVAARRALESYCHALINSAAFMYVD